MTAQVTINPLLTSVASGSFAAESVGFMQGVMLDDPAVRYALSGGVLANSETIPMWGGVGISEFIAGNTSPGYIGSPGGPSGALGGQIYRATALTGSKALTGFSVFNQAHSMIQTPQSPVQLAPSGGLVNFLRLGSGARISVKADPGLAAYQSVDIITQPVAWDFVNQQLIPQVTSATITALTYVSGTGVVTLTTSAAHGIGVGDTITTAAITGTGSIASTIGTFTTGAGTTGSTITYTIATGLTLAYTSGGTVTTGSALNVRLLDVQLGNSMVVAYDPTTGFATWNRAGTTAIILI